MGAGIGGLACAARLAAAGCRVTVIEAASAPGGKLRELVVGGLAIDSGPTVLTMRWVFEELFAACGAELGDALPMTRLATLARHAWPGGGGELDMFADRARTADAIGRFAGIEAVRGYMSFAARARMTYETLERSFIRAERPSVLSLVTSGGFAGLRGLWRMAPYSTLWDVLGTHFRDPRLRQVFARYATYCGASPMAAPATLMLVSHVEQEGVWAVTGGMHRLARAVVALAERHGAVCRFGAQVAGVTVRGGRASGVRLASGERIDADAVVLNADQAALGAGLFGEAAQAASPPLHAPRSLSAMTWSIAGTPKGFDLLRHNVFFCEDYAAELDDVFVHARMPRRPTVYLCASDRLDDAPSATGRTERLFGIVNAPAIGDTHDFDAAEQTRYTQTMHRLLADCGLEITCAASTVTTPADWARLFPATRGALYGPATHGAMASFRRRGARTRMASLYLAGGSVHPGAGVPMAALSGALAAACVLKDGGSMRR